MTAEKRKTVIRKAHLSQIEQQNVRSGVKAQLRVINSQKMRFNKPVWHREITKRLLETALPHCRRGAEDFRTGRDRGYFMGGLMRDLKAFKEARLPLRKKGEILRRLKVEIEACEMEAGVYKEGLSIKARRDFGRGYIRGKELAILQMQSFDMPTEIPNPSRPDYSTKLLTFLWNRLPQILTRFKRLDELYECIFQKPAGEYPEWNHGFKAFQKQCQRLGIKLGKSGRPRKA